VDEVEGEGEVEDVRGAADEVVERGDAGGVQSAIGRSGPANHGARVMDW
jgi:hypothetical protein